MKTATIPSLRVSPELRQAAESVLAADESLSSFVEQSLRIGIEHRRLQHEFIQRGLMARDEARQSGEYFPADQIRADLDEMLNTAETAAGTQPESHR